MLSLKTLRKVMVKVQRNFNRWSFPLSFCCMKLAHGRMNLDSEACYGQKSSYEDVQPLTSFLDVVKLPLTP